MRSFIGISDEVEIVGRLDTGIDRYWIVSGFLELS